MHINTFDFHVVHVNSKTNWSFVRVALEDGSIGWGECSLNGWEPLQAAYADTFRNEILGRQVRSARDAAALCETFLHSPGGLVVHSIRSACEVALIDALARANGVSVANFLSQSLEVEIKRTSVPVYANINRGTQPRSPEGFAHAAKSAVAQGFSSVKLAPFDGVLPSNCELPEAHAPIEEGIARIYAVREAVGPNIGVKVDCHWRFTPRVAHKVLERLRDAKLDWLECPVSEHAAFHEAIVMLRKVANAMNIGLAGAEMLTGLEGFRPLLERDCYNTIMPDVKYCGGLVALFDIAALAAKHGVQTAPHNPTGPICNLASLHACAIGDGCSLLEYQLGESDLYRTLVAGAHPAMAASAFVVPNDPGLGAAVDPTIAALHPYRPVLDGLHPSLG
jgi:galactonate dehydratase